MTENRLEKIKQWAASSEAGDLVAAGEIARQLVAANAQDGQALCMLAQTLFRRGERLEAVDFMRGALELDPMSAPFNDGYGVMLAALGRWDEAANAHGMAAVLDPANVDARFNLALALFRGGGVHRARVELDRVLTMRPDLPDALALDGELLYREGKAACAAESFRKAIGRGLKTPRIHIELARALKEARRDDEALEALQMAERLADGDAAACLNLGDFYHGEGDGAKAEHFLRRAIELDPGFVEAHRLLGWFLLWKKADPAGARACFTQALAIDPRSSLVWHNLSYALRCLFRLDEAEQACRRALEIEPGLANYRLGELLLLRGRLAEGWPCLEDRFTVDGRWQFSHPNWNGEALGERSLMIFGEEGLGDNLHCARYLPLLRERHPNARIYFRCQSSLYRLFACHAAAWGVEILPPLPPADLPHYDVQIIINSLHGRMGTRLENIPARVPYIVPPEDLSKKWAARLDSLPGKKIGLAWAGSDLLPDIHTFRAIRLEQLAPLLDVRGINWISLQKGKHAGQIAEAGWSDRILDLMDEVSDYADTAAIVAHLDLVVSTDTSVPHLAGAMGKPVWLLNHFDTDWRWFLDREDSPWYPTMRIFRQTSFGSDWTDVVRRMAQALTEWVAEGGDSAKA